VLGFFLDSALTRPITASAPKRFLSPLAGIVKASTVYLGDPYSALVMTAASISASSLVLDDTSEFLPSGSAVVTDLAGTQTVSYTGITDLTLTGVTGVTAAIQVNSKIIPNKHWVARSQVSITPAGADLSTLGVSVQADGGGFTYPGMPLILSWSSLELNGLTTGQNKAIGIQMYIPAGAQGELVHWGLSVGPLYPLSVGVSVIPSGAIGSVSPYMYGYVNQQDQMLPQHMRLLPDNRDVSSAPAGFTIGQYCWRDDTEINAQAIVPTNWLTDPSTMGAEKFIPGIGCGDDLEPLGFTQQDNSIHLEINRGFYYTGYKGYYLPAQPQLDIFNALVTELPLSAVPQPLLPIFVGTYSLDSQGFYEKSIEYRYQTAAAVTRDVDMPEYYYTLDRATDTITLNQPLPLFSAYLGVIGGSATDYFNLPVYPVDNVSSVYVQRSDNTRVVGANWTFNKDLGTIVISNPTPLGAVSSIAGTVQGEMVMAACTLALAVLYETGASDSLVLDNLDLNPAFAGISGGYVYLQQSRQNPGSIVLSCDKPLINIPATFSSIVGLVAYGPVNFNGDYALLQATVYSQVPGQIVQGVELEAVVDDPDFLGTPWSGTLNGIDPTVAPVIVTTGADGSANLIFRPQKEYGFSIPPIAAAGGLAGLATTTLVDDTIVLPEPVAISQIWASADASPWLVTLYTVYNNDPLFGKVGAGPGEIPWDATTGINGPGTVGYKTNGRLVVVASAPATPLYPLWALDSAGRNQTNSLFSGEVVSLVYNQTLPTTSTVGAYFLTLTQRVLVRMKAVNSNVESNAILLEMAPPALIIDNLWLILNDAINGILNQYRLG